MSAGPATPGQEAVPPAGRRSRVAVATADPLTPRMAGPAIRAWHIARALAQDCDVRLVTTSECTIDSPDFCLRVARILRARGRDLPIIHYVAPSVWAWRPGRAARMAPLVDHVLALLPFEPPFMHAAGISCDFVGHPVVAEPRASAAEAAAFRETYMIGPDQPLVCCALPVRL